MEVFSKQALQERQQKCASQLQRHLQAHEVLVVFCGQPLVKPGGLDQTYPFLPHPDYYWLSGSRVPGGLMCFTLDRGWEHHQPPITVSEKIWEGAVDLRSSLSIQDFLARFANLSGRVCYWMGQADDSIMNLLPFRPATNEIREALNSVRRCKDAEELKLIRACADFAKQGFQAVAKLQFEGMTEREIQLVYEGAVLHAGAEKMPYETIVGAGARSAILHAIPSANVVKPGDFILLDGGADKFDYGVDVTRMFVAAREMSEQQGHIFSIVQRAQQAARALCRPGVQWIDVHRAAAAQIATGLGELGLLNCSQEAAMESGLVGLFFPHGVGHLVGLRVRDVGPIAGAPPAEFAGIKLRVNIQLEANQLVTVEPGLYFIEGLLNSTSSREKYKNELHWSRLASWLQMGGVRIEDDILITAKGSESLTQHIPIL